MAVGGRMIQWWYQLDLEDNGHIITQLLLCLLHHACIEKLYFIAGAPERHTVPGNTDQFVLSGLTSNTSYRVSLQAASRQGVGPATVRHYTTRLSLDTSLD